MLVFYVYNKFTIGFTLNVIFEKEKLRIDLMERDTDFLRIEADKEALILELLKNNQNGLSISEISSSLNLNRNSTSKYLQVLETKGCVERCSMGRAKLYYLPRRPPVSSLLSLSSELICTFDTLGFLTYANDKFLKFFGLDEFDSLFMTIEELSEITTSSPLNIGAMSDLIKGATQVQEFVVNHDGLSICIRARAVETTFEDESTGITILIEDNTAAWKYRNNVEFLAITAEEFSSMDIDDDICQYIADMIAELEPRAHVVVSSLDTSQMVCITKACSGERRFSRAMDELFGPVWGEPVSIENASWAIPLLMQGKLIEGPDSLFIQTYKMFPKDLCDQIEEKLGLGNNYSMGCVCEGGIYGSITIRYRYDDDLQNPEAIEAFVKMAGIALQKQYLKKRLGQSEAKYQRLESRIQKKKIPSERMRAKNL